MKLNKILQINNVTYPLISDQTTLVNENAGTAVFVVESSAPLKGVIKLFAGWNGKAAEYFTGFILNCFPIDKFQQRVFCAEPAKILEQRLPLMLRNATTKEIIQAIEEKTMLKFIIPDDAPWIKTKMSHVVSVGNGYELLDWMADELGLSWNPLADGSIRFDKQYSEDICLLLDPSAVKDLSIKGCSLPLLPQIRPGMMIQIGEGRKHRIERIESNNISMRINWKVPGYERRNFKNN
jgi:hypothetical protein